MNKSGLSLSGIDQAVSLLKTIKRRSTVWRDEALAESLAFLETKAKEILDREVYDKPRGAFAEPLDRSESDSLYASFAQRVSTTGDTAVTGLLVNTSDHAVFLESGTDDEGTGSHFVGVANAKALHWVDVHTGAHRFGSGHMVKGITPIRFMERALSENEDAVVEIFRKHYRGSLT